MNPITLGTAADDTAPGEPGADYMTLHDMAAELSATAADLAAAIDAGSATGPLSDRATDLACLVACAAGSGSAPVDLAFIARALDGKLRENQRETVTGESQLDVQALCVAEETGELVGAYRRWAGKARRSGTFRDLEDEVADVVISTAVFAERAGIDLNTVIRRKLSSIYSRGWRDDNAPAGHAIAQRPGPCWKILLDGDWMEPWNHIPSQAEARKLAEEFAGHIWVPGTEALAAPCWTVTCPGCGRKFQDPDPFTGHEPLHTETPELAAETVANAGWCAGGYGCPDMNGVDAHCPACCPAADDGSGDDDD